MNIQAFDPETFTLTDVVFDPASRDAVVIDPVLFRHLYNLRGGMLAWNDARLLAER